MIKLVCKLNKVTGKIENTVYENGAVLYTLDDDGAYDMVQNNTVKEFKADDFKYYYFETYWF